MKNPSPTIRTLHYYWLMLKKYKKYSIPGFLLTPIVILVRSVVEPYILADMIGKATSGLTGDALIQALLPEALALMILYTVSNVIFEKLRLYVIWKMEVLAMYDLATICFETICAQSMQFHDDRFSGSLVSQTNRFSGSFERFIDVIIWDLLPLVVSVIFITIILWQRVPIFAAGLLGFVIAYVTISGLSSRRMAKLAEAEAATNAKVTGQLADSISNIISVKSYGCEEYETARYNHFQKKWLKTALAQLIYTLKRDLWYSVINLALLAGVIYFMVMGNSLGISASTLVLIVNYSHQVLSSIWDVNHVFKNIVRSFGDAKEMTEILDLPDDVVDARSAYDMEMKDSGVEFSHIKFRHADARETIFDDFNLSVKPGERIGLVGISGSGKSTLTKLLLRFADVDDGEIRVGGHDIKKITQKSLRQNIAYVPQETALFHRSIADNIAYAKPDASREEIIRAAKLANADEFIRETPEGYDTLVGERGVKLSGGQRQRIAIARAILKNAPILVLDEATSALDSESEQLIQGALGELMKNRTSIVIAHRLSTVASLDRIIVLDHGRIVEEGSHHELLKAAGEYAKLWSRQSGAFMEEGAR